MAHHGGSSFCLSLCLTERHVLNVLSEYLTHSNASPLQKALVEVKTPYAGAVEFDEEPYKVGRRDELCRQTCTIACAYSVPSYTW